MAMMRQRSRKGPLPPAQEHINKLEKAVNDGDYYGAQQMYKSYSARYASAERYYEALDILESGACIQLKKGQVTCGAELAILFVETLVKGKFQYDDDTLGKRTSIGLHSCCVARKLIKVTNSLSDAKNEYIKKLDLEE